MSHEQHRQQEGKRMRDRQRNMKRNGGSPKRYPPKKGKPNACISIRTTPDGRKYEFHPTKGFRKWVNNGPTPKL